MNLNNKKLCLKAKNSLWNCFKNKKETYNHPRAMDRLLISISLENRKTIIEMGNNTKLTDVMDWITKLKWNWIDQLPRKNENEWDHTMKLGQS